MSPSARSRLRTLCCVAAGGLAISGLMGEPSAAEPAPPQLTASGSIAGLYPGTTAVLTVRVNSSFDQTIVLDSLTTAPQPTAAGCERYLHIADMIGTQVVPAAGSIDVALPTTFDFAAPDGCQKAVIPLVFTINGEEVAAALPAAEEVEAEELPQSGWSPRPLAWIGALAFGCGAGLLGLGRRRAR